MYVGRGAALIVLVLALAGCETSRSAVTSPSAVPPAGRLAAAAPGDGLPEALQHGDLGALQQGVTHSAAQESGFTCALLGLGLAVQSHATISNSGNQTLHCSGRTTVFTPDRTIVLEGSPCQLHYENAVTLDSRLIVTPSGQVTLTCQAKK